LRRVVFLRLGHLLYDRLFKLVELVRPLSLSFGLFACLFFLVHGVHYSIQMKVDQLLVRREELEPGRSVDQLQPRDLSNVVVVGKYVFDILLLVRFKH